jgi:hypothetical protein
MNTSFFVLHAVSNLLGDIQVFFAYFIINISIHLFIIIIACVIIAVAIYYDNKLFMDNINQQQLIYQHQLANNIRERRLRTFWEKILAQHLIDIDKPDRLKRPIQDDTFPDRAILEPIDYFEAQNSSYLMKNYYHRKDKFNVLLDGNWEIRWIPNSNAGPHHTNEVGERGKPANASNLLEAKLRYNAPN